MRPQLSVPLAALLALTPAASQAEVAASSDSGFVSHNEVLVRATPAEAWDAMVRPSRYWNGDHSYSGDPANLTLAPNAGGCFCEAIPAKDGAPAGQVEHMRVIYAAPGALLRLSGGLGPLQSEPITGVLTMTLVPDGDMTKITWDYAVGGYMRTPAAEIAPLVDQVIGEQLLRLAASLGQRMDPASRRAP
jgi:hypothetical protein